MEEVSVKEIRCLCGYVLKEDCLSKYLTPREIIMDSAQFRLGSETSQHQKEESVLKIIKLMKLGKVANTYIHDLKGLYGEPAARVIKKRVMIAAELVRDCAILVLEDPGFGMGYEEQLDIITALRDIADTGKIIISTMELPEVDVIKNFDQILLLHEG